MSRRRRVAPAVLTALAVAVASTACAGSPAEPPLPGKPPIVTVSMREHTFAYPTPVPSGRVVFRFVNEGRFAHQPDLLPLGENLPPIDVQLRGEERAAVTPFAGIPDREPGDVGTFAVDLVVGRRYALICFARDPDDDESHALQGMASEFRAGGVQPSTTTPPPPATTATTTG